MMASHIIWATSTDQMRENAKAAEIKLSSDDLAQIGCHSIGVIHAGWTRKQKRVIIFEGRAAGKPAARPDDQTLL